MFSIIIRHCLLYKQQSEIRGHCMYNAVHCSRQNSTDNYSYTALGFKGLNPASDKPLYDNQGLLSEILLHILSSSEDEDGIPMRWDVIPMRFRGMGFTWINVEKFIVLKSEAELIT